MGKIGIKMSDHLAISLDVLKFETGLFMFDGIHHKSLFCVERVILKVYDFFFIILNYFDILKLKILKIKKLIYNLNNHKIYNLEI